MSTGSAPRRCGGSISDGNCNLAHGSPKGWKKGAFLTHRLFPNLSPPVGIFHHLPFLAAIQTFGVVYFDLLNS